MTLEDLLSATHNIIVLDGRYYQHLYIQRRFNVRNITANGRYLWSLYCFYDERKTRVANNFGQVTLGGELQTKKMVFQHQRVYSSRVALYLQ